MKITATTNKGTHEYFLPDSWERLPTGTYQRIVGEWDGKELIKLFSILSGIDYAGIAESNSQELEEHLIAGTAYIFASKPDFMGFDIPETITLSGVTVKVPKLLGRMSIGQNIRVRQRLAALMVKAGLDKKEEVLQADLDVIYAQLIACVIAVYLQPRVDGGIFNDDRAEILEAEVEKMPIIQTYVLGFFFAREAHRLWLDHNARMEPAKTEVNAHRATVSKMAQVDRLVGFADLSMVGKFAAAFGQHPDRIDEETSFDTVSNFLFMWKEQGEFDDRYAAIEKEMKAAEIAPGPDGNKR